MLQRPVLEKMFVETAILSSGYVNGLIQYKWNRTLKKKRKRCVKKRENELEKNLSYNFDAFSMACWSRIFDNGGGSPSLGPTETGPSGTTLFAGIEFASPEMFSLAREDSSLEDSDSCCQCYKTFFLVPDDTNQQALAFVSGMHFQPSPVYVGNITRVGAGIGKIEIFALYHSHLLQFQFDFLH